MKEIVFGVIALGFLGWGAVALYAGFTCHWPWSDSGLQTKYSVFAGCRVGDGEKFVPESRYREVAK